MACNSGHHTRFGQEDLRCFDVFCKDGSNQAGRYWKHPQNRQLVYHGPQVFTVRMPVATSNHTAQFYAGVEAAPPITSEEAAEKYGGVVPSDKDELQTLPGVGNKTAGVIRAEIFHIPDLPVDTHILRISKRFGLVGKDTDPYETEMKLKKLIDESLWIKTHHQLIHFGRYLCTARKPACESCKLAHLCNKTI